MSIIAVEFYMAKMADFTTILKKKEICLVTVSQEVSGPEVEDSSTILSMWLSGSLLSFSVHSLRQRSIRHDPEISLITSFTSHCSIEYHMATAGFEEGWET